jgi:ubiquitin-conjugating enzyme E2 D/E
MALKRLTKELGDIKKNCPDGIYAEPIDDSLYEWEGTIDGPNDTPYEGGKFILNIVVPNEYPFKPPKIVFETYIYHCNISKEGEICLDTLKDQWSPALNISQTLMSIQSLLDNPNPKDPLRPDIAQLYLSNKEEHDEKARYETEKHAL